MGGAEFTVGEAFDPAFGFGVADVFCVPLVFWHIGKAISVVERHGFGRFRSFDDDFGDFGAVDAVVGAESVFAVIALDDLAAIEGANGLFVVMAFDVVEFGVGGNHRKSRERKEKREKRKED